MEPDQQHAWPMKLRVSYSVTNVALRASEAERVDCGWRLWRFELQGIVSHYLLGSPFITRLDYSTNNMIVTRLAVSA